MKESHAFRILRSAAFLFLTGTGASLLAQGEARAASAYAPIAELGVKFYSATATPSITGSMGYFLNLRAEKRKGFFRPQVAAEIEFSSGLTRLAEDDTPAYSMYGGGFLAGANFFLFQDSQLLPFVGANGILGWNLIKLTGQQESVEANTQGLSFGYEVNAGCDIRTKAGADRAVRLRTSYWQTTSSLAGQTGFILSGWRISLGLVF